MTTGQPRHDELSFRLQPTRIAPSVARRWLARWLDRVAWPPSGHDQVLLAVSEAVTNAVEHGHGVSAQGVSVEGQVLVQVRIVVGKEPDQRGLLVTVRDDGGWKQESDQPGRGLGLLLVRELSDDLQVDGREAGTTVTFSFHSLSSDRR